MGLINSDGQIDDILSLTVRDLCERRIQSLTLKKGLARTLKQARQFITHRHICIGEKRVTSPSYLVSIEEEPLMCFSQISSLVSEDHPERHLEKDNPKT